MTRLVTLTKQELDDLPADKLEGLFACVREKGVPGLKSWVEKYAEKTHISYSSALHHIRTDEKLGPMYREALKTYSHMLMGEVLPAVDANSANVPFGTLKSKRLMEMAQIYNREEFGDKNQTSVGAITVIVNRGTESGDSTLTIDNQSPVLALPT